MNKVEVVIGGEIITLVSGENEEYMQKLSRYIDKKLNEIKSMKTNAAINERTRTLFIAINIADDYFRASERLKTLENEHERFVVELGRMQEENYLLAEKLHEFQGLINDKNSAEAEKPESQTDKDARNKNVSNIKKLYPS